MAKPTPPAVAAPGQPLDALYTRPGFLIRRANQIAVWLFLDEVAPLPTTTTQYGALVILRERGDMDQIGLAKLLRIDKSTAALVVGKLEAAGQVSRQTDAADRRRNVLRITDAGLQALRDLAEPAEQARLRLLAAFTPREQQTFLALLERYVEGHASLP
jgi:DNA-binding MarR family transcriptional regulator